MRIRTTSEMLNDALNHTSASRYGDALSFLDSLHNRLSLTHGDFVAIRRDTLRRVVGSMRATLRAFSPAQERPACRNSA